MLKDVFYFGNKPNAHPRERHANSLAHARSMSTTDHFWIINEFCDYRNFEWDWDFYDLPDEDVWATDHNNVWPSQYQKDSGTWLCSKNDSDIIIYRNDVSPINRRFMNLDSWENYDHIDKSSFDFNWHPDPTDPPFIYQFGTKWHANDGPRYIVPGAAQIKYVDHFIATPLVDMTRWTVPDDVDTSGFDFSWHPDPNDPPYIYQFGTQWQKTGGPVYTVSGATQIKYVGLMKATKLANKSNWINILDIDTFDYSWHPDATDPPFTYVFGNKYNSAELEPTIKYVVPGSTSIKHINDVVASLKQRPDLFENKDNIESFDFGWRPNPTEEPFIYQFGTQWQKTDGPRYIATGATVVKFIDEPRAIIRANLQHWEMDSDYTQSDFDFSWHPDATSPPYIYQFGTLLDEDDGPRYVTPGNDGTIVHLVRSEIDISKLSFPKYYIKTTLEDLISEHAGEIFWALNSDIDYSGFDFKWVPNKENVFHINAFGSEDNINTQTYFVNGKMYAKGHRDINYVEDKVINVKTNLDIFYVDRGNTNSEPQFNELKKRLPNIQKTRYLNSWVDTISRCVNKASTTLFWALDSQLDYTNFEFDYYPSPWQMRMVHVFGTQWSHWGSTYMINKDTFIDDTKYIKVIEHLSNINFVKRKTALATNCLYDMYVIDHGNKETEQVVNSVTAKSSGRQLNVVPYQGSYLETFKEILADVEVKKDHYIWVCSSVCNYDSFDFTYISDPFAKDQLHVFPSDKQKFGDTFLIDVNKLRSLINDLEQLDDYEKVNFNNHNRATRFSPPVITTYEDTHYKTATIDFDFPYALLKTVDNQDLAPKLDNPMSLWSADTKNIIILSEGGTNVIVPKEAKSYVKKELYDYPYITKQATLLKSKPLDIVFLSNGETGADENYEHLLKVTKGLPNRVVRVDGVDGRVAAYHAAADASETPWMLTVFAKLKVDSNFNWNWQPDRLQIPKHYIFNAHNPVNGLVYGHQAMIAYNKKITLANPGRGLDFTLDDEHEVVELNSGVALYNTDEWSTWRTSFREVLKLKATTVANPSDETSAKRLWTWTNIAAGDFAQYCLDGASDAIAYFDETEGDSAMLKLSYDWAWLRERFDQKYK